MPLTRSSSPPPAAMAAMMRRPLENVHLLGKTRMPGAEFLFDDEKPEAGLLAVIPAPRPGMPGFAVFSTGERRTQMTLTAEVPAGEPRLWVMPSNLHQALADMVDFGGGDQGLVYTRDDREPFPVRTARPFDTGDLAVLEAQRQVSPRALSSPDLRVKVFGVIDGGTWLADGWAFPLFDGHWAIGNVYVREDRRGQGLGHDVVAACANHILQEGGQPVYECVDRNVPSRRTAESLGFRVAAEYFEAMGVRRG